MIIQSERILNTKILIIIIINRTQTVCVWGKFPSAGSQLVCYVIRKICTCRMQICESPLVGREASHLYNWKVGGVEWWGVFFKRNNAKNTISNLFLVVIKATTKGKKSMFKLARSKKNSLQIFCLLGINP